MNIEIETRDVEDLSKRAARTTHFYCAAPRADRVEIAGDFNQWQPLPMHRTTDGWWLVELELGHGRHLYRFLVDGKPMLDPQAGGMGRDEQGERVSLIAVR